jgi:hypothetical protein
VFIVKSKPHSSRFGDQRRNGVQAIKTAQQDVQMAAEWMRTSSAVAGGGVRADFIAN